ncbi:sensor domain-containing diguanylate cyclase [Thalassobacillus devorans]|uniref:sensor domain-containing diguanylate cyclase n=1 Tax=Thalassobacillus devorans TaxID=279813 RepID=UPI000A1CD5AE|nr:sensor domain-containing diguanylate cyclase [Thalassobacillus devorans]
MIIQGWPLYLFALLIAILANFIRFKGGTFFNKSILVVAAFALLSLQLLSADIIYFRQLAFLLIAVATLAFRIPGGLLSAVIAWGVLLGYGDREWNVLFHYLLFAAVIHATGYLIRKVRSERRQMLSMLVDNAKQLNVFKEVSFAMQQTFQMEKLLQTILTSVTAGHGLGFNRAMILLNDEEETKLTGVMGTGPMTAEEGYTAWEEIARNRYELKDLIAIKTEETNTDRSLNERVKKLEIPLDQPNFLTKALASGKPLHIENPTEKGAPLRSFAEQFHMKELVVFPLINQGVKVGVLIIDNPVNKRAITAGEIDAVLPLANQAAIAIHHSRLYNKIDVMAHTDGLTGLLNQRAFQSALTEHFPDDREGYLSLILLDIDFFKHFNDTNGHLLGNDVLIQLAQVIRSSIRKSDKAFRFGGEEFVVLLPNTTKEEAELIAERIRSSVENTIFPCGEKQPGGCLTVSLGVAAMNGEPSNQPTCLVDAADQALYQAKASGKNKVFLA